MITVLARAMNSIAEIITHQTWPNTCKHYQIYPAAPLVVVVESKLISIRTLELGAEGFGIVE